MCKPCLDRGLNIDEFAPRLSFFFNSHIDFSEEIGQIPSRPQDWARIMRERFRAQNPRFLDACASTPKPPAAP